MTNKKIYISILLLLFISISIAQANTTAPPQSIKVTGFISSHNQSGIWWENPPEFDFNGVQVWFDNSFITTTSPSTVFYNNEFLSPGNHIFSTHTIDTSSNANLTWVNVTINNNGTCYEGWFLDNWCEVPPLASFTKNISNGLYVLPVQFTDTSTLNATGWNWSFGDGTFSDLQNPLKQYSSGGVYTVNLTAWNTNTTRNWITDSVEVWNHTTNDFTANVTVGYTPLTVQFTDTSYNATSWYWMFGSGEGTSTQQNPNHTYIFSGFYTVNHSSSNGHDTYWTNKTNYIEVQIVPDTDPPASITNLVGVEANCQQINWTWTNPTDPDFSVTQVWIDNVFKQNISGPTHNYSASGLTDAMSHTISTHTVDNTGNVNGTWVNNTISLSACPSLAADFTIAQNSTCIPSDVYFINTTYSYFPLTNFWWNITNGGIKVDYTTDTVHVIYNDAGSWNINLTVKDNTGNTSTKFRGLTTTNCSIPIPPTTLVPGNVTQPQVPAQTSGKYTDITIWGILFAITLICMVLSRDVTVSTMRPMIFVVISFITSIAATWSSLSIAYMGDFVQGAVMRYTNQSTATIYHYQVIQVVSAPWLTVLCVIVTIFVIINGVDIVMRYIKKGEESEQEQTMRWKI